MVQNQNMKSKSKVPQRLVTAALPYANGPIHIGHLVGYLQADYWVRWNKMNGVDIRYVCGDDTHGTPIMIRARELNTSPVALIEKTHAEHLKDFTDFGVEFDVYSSTNTEENRIFAEEFYKKMRDQGHTNTRTVEQFYCEFDKMFLPDRFVKGVCPKCGAEEQYGDSCDKCGATYAATDLKKPHCSVCRNTPVLKAAETIAFQVSDFRDYLRTWVKEHAPLEVANKLSEWIDGELYDWDISREAPYFGFRIPDTKSKYFYVWLDAPIGYISSTYRLCRDQGLDFDAIWKSGPTQIYHFIGKDIIKFHCLFWPATLKTVGFKSPEQVFVNGFLTVNGEKMSKSKGTLISARTFIENCDPEALRYYFASKLNGELQDLDLGLTDFVNRYNSDLVGKITNLGSRGAQMLTKRLDSKLGGWDRPDNQQGRELVAAVQKRRANLAKHFEARDFAKATQDLREIADEANKYFDEKAPWNLIKTDPEATRAVLTTTLNLFRQIVIGLQPLMPKFAREAAALFNESVYQWADGEKIITTGTVKEYSHLATRIEPEKLNAMVELTKPVMPGQTAPTLGAAKVKEEKAETNYLDIETFSKVDLRIGKIVSAEAIPDADKLVKLQIDLGELGTRQIFAGIKSAYSPEKLQGRLTVVVANLAPRKMKFGMSEGMVLAASDPSGAPGLYILSPDSGAKPGDRVK